MTEKNRIKALFERKPKNVLSVFCTAGYPNFDSIVPVIKALQDAGADMVEIGMPFSDPTADGPVIQHSNNVAIGNGMTIAHLFEQIAKIRDEIHIPLVLMGYLNPPMQYGWEKFLDQASACGIDGLILPDLPVREFKTEYQKGIESRGLSNIFLVTPQTPESRVREIDALTDGFIYVVSTNTITGGHVDFEAGQKDYFKQIESYGLKNPALVGFGIRDKYTFDVACKYLNGAIIGTAFIKALENTEDIPSSVTAFVKSIKGEG
jgi:tryptophan synthase alpha chain